MISAIDRHFGFSGGESLALLTLIALSAWLAYPHLPALQHWFDHARVVAGRIAADVS